MVGKLPLTLDITSKEIVAIKTTDGGHTFELIPVPDNAPYIGVPQRIFYPSIDTAYILAEHGQLLRSRDSGRTWEVISVIRDLSMDFFTPMHFRTSQTAIVAARGIPETADSVDMMYRTTDGGQTWSSEALPSPPGDSIIHPRAICDFESGRTSVIWYDVISRQHFFSTRAGGSAIWRHVVFPDSRGFFEDFVCTSESTYYLTYWVRITPSQGLRYHYSIIHRTTDYGETWDTVFNGFGRDSAVISDLDFRDSVTGIATSEDAIFRTTDGGDTWTTEPLNPPAYQPNRVIASYPQGSDGIIVTSGIKGTHVYLPEKIGGVTDRLRHAEHLMNAQLSPISNSTEYLLTFESPDGAGVRIQLYDLVGSALFSAEYETTVGSNRIVVELPPHSSSAGFLRILSGGGGCYVSGNVGFVSSEAGAAVGKERELGIRFAADGSGAVRISRRPFHGSDRADY